MKLTPEGGMFKRLRRGVGAAAVAALAATGSPAPQAQAGYQEKLVAAMQHPAYKKSLDEARSKPIEFLKGLHDLPATSGHGIELNEELTINLIAEAIAAGGDQAKDLAFQKLRALLDAAEARRKNPSRGITSYPASEVYEYEVFMALDKAAPQYLLGRLADVLTDDDFYDGGKVMYGFAEMTWHNFMCPMIRVKTGTASEGDKKVDRDYEQIRPQLSPKFASFIDRFTASAAKGEEHPDFNDAGTYAERKCRIPTS